MSLTKSKAGTTSKVICQGEIEKFGIADNIRKEEGNHLPLMKSK